MLFRNIAISVIPLLIGIMMMQAAQTLILPVPILLLQTPYNDEVLQNSFPVFQWQTASLPEDSTAAYFLKVVEVFPGQTNQQAIVQNPALFQQTVTNGMYSWSATDPALLPGHTYAWQILAYNDGVFINASEVWEFSILENFAPPILDSTLVDTQYVDIAAVSSLNVIDARGGIGVRIDYPFSEGSLAWTLHDAQANLLTGNGVQVSLTSANLFFFGMNNSTEIIPGDYYLLTVTDKNYLQHSMRIRYVPW